MSWHRLPTELHLAILHRLPHPAVRALAATSPDVRALCLPALFADVSLPDAASLDAFVRHVPTRYGQYVRSLTVCTKQPHGATGVPTDAVLALLATTTRLNSLSLSLASPLDAEKAVPVFSRLLHVHSFEIGGWATEDIAPISERLAVALAASLPSLAHLTLTRITRSAIHVDPCDVPYDVPIVTNDFDVPPHPLLGSDLALPNLLSIPSLRTLDIRDTWLGCDTKIEPAKAPLEKLCLTGSMYTADARCEAQACTAWLSACPGLRSFDIASALAPLELPLPRVPQVHVNASRFQIDDLSSTLDAIRSCAIESISIASEEERRVDAPKSSPEDDEFARECALDDLADWSAAIEAFLCDRSEEWKTLARVDVRLPQNVHASWVL